MDYSPDEQRAIDILNSHLFQREHCGVLRVPVNWIIGTRSKILSWINENAYTPSSFEGVVSNFYCSSFDTFCSIIANLWIRGNMDAAVSLRTLLETTIGLSYLCRAPSQRAPLFVDYAAIKTGERLQWYEDKRKHSIVVADQTMAEAIRKQAREAEARRKRYRQNSGIKGWRNRSWSGLSIERMANEAGKEMLYKRFYSLCSHAVHVNQLRLRSYCSQDSGRIYSVEDYQLVGMACLVMSEILEEVVKALDIKNIDVDQLTRLAVEAQEAISRAMNQDTYDNA